jgi:hypothetical protein
VAVFGYCQGILSIGIVIQFQLRARLSLIRRIVVSHIN